VIAVVCNWGGDLLVGPTGDIGVAPIQNEAEQRIIRRLLTNPGDYIWHLTYGAGLGAYVGQPYSSKSVESTILTQIQSEPIVVSNPSPLVQIQQSLANSTPATSVTIQYQIAGAGPLNSVAFTLGAE
jgi:hypothetical protein